MKKNSAFLSLRLGLILTTLLLERTARAHSPSSAKTASLASLLLAIFTARWMTRRISFQKPRPYSAVIRILIFIALTIGFFFVAQSTLGIALYILLGG